MNAAGDDASQTRVALLDVGVIVKAHGLRGEVVVSLTTDRTERLDPGSVLTAAGRELEVVAARPHQQRWIVLFKGVTDRNGADELHGQVLQAPPIDDPDALWVHELIGAMALDPAGNELGRVVAVQASPASDLLELESGALVPERFVVGWASPGRLTIDPPDGLLDLD